jgi:hypothetical protein
MKTLIREDGMQIQTTWRELPKKTKGLRFSPETPVVLTIKENLSTPTKDDAFQSLLDFKPIKGIRPVVDVIREIRDTE